MRMSITFSFGSEHGNDAVPLRPSMRRAAFLRGVLALLLACVVSATLVAKSPTTRVRIDGGGFSSPIVITQDVAQFRIWGALIMEWSAGPAFFDYRTGTTTGGPSPAFRRYRVSFFVTDAPNASPAYVVTYARRPDTGEAFVYLPGKGEEWYGVNAGSILRFVEGHWFRPTAAWEKAVAPLLMASPSSGPR